jgi:hypothetical protein
MSIAARVHNITFDTLKTAQKHFNANPSSTNYSILTRAMLVYQQVSQLHKPCNAKSTAPLMTQLEAMTPSEWPETIVRHSLNMSIADALA